LTDYRIATQDAYGADTLVQLEFIGTFACFVYRLTKSDFREPVNIGSDEMVSMNEMAEIVLSFENKKLPIHHIPGPEGVRGRNSDNTLIKEKLGWAPTMRLKVNSQTFCDKTFCVTALLLLNSIHHCNLEKLILD